MVSVLRLIAVICTAFILGKLVSKIKLPAILGWLIAGVVFGPYLACVVTLEITNALWYKITIKVFECFAGVMIGREIIFRKLVKSGKQIVGITFVQSIGTFAVVSATFCAVFVIAGIPFRLGFIFGGIALATAPAPALSIVNEYKTNGPVTKTLIPLAALDDVIGVIVFFTVIAVFSSANGGADVSPWQVVAIVLIPFAIGILTGGIAGGIIKAVKGRIAGLILLMLFLCASAGLGFVVDFFLFRAFNLNYLLIGMAFSATVANIVPEEKLNGVLSFFNPILTFSLVIVIVNLGMPLDYRLIAGAGLYTFIYILSRAVGKVGGAFVGGKIVKADPKVTKYLGFTLLPHSGVSLVFTGIAVSALNGIDASLASLVSGTIVAAAIINEIIAVITAKIAFRKAGEIGGDGMQRN